MNKETEFERAYGENLRQVNQIIHTLADAPHSDEQVSALNQLGDLKITMQKQQERLTVAA